MGKRFIAVVTYKGTHNWLVIREDSYTSKKKFAADLRAYGYHVKFISTPERYYEDLDKYHKRLKAMRERRNTQ